MVAEHRCKLAKKEDSCSLAKISMVAERAREPDQWIDSCSLAKISMVAEPQNI